MRAHTGGTAVPRDTDVRDFDSAGFREALSHYASGLTVVTGIDDDGPVGFTCQSFYSVSMDPPLVSISVMRTSDSYPRLRRSGRFAVNVLSAAQQPLSEQFARKGVDRWTGVGWTQSPSGNPLLRESLLWVDCELWAEHEAGDHLIVIGHVQNLGRAEPAAAAPLIFYRGRYHELSGAPSHIGSGSTHIEATASGSGAQGNGAPR
ncbi:flavin reductase family protein [Microbacterium sp. zg.B48]|uniref:flavin reductase family protein n=1 Tax=Microbacterium sp. zg.B48 TaxID=2969408 RepID=UPI00214CDF2A|nr:flavin reductase family protein [Microbacterium sp. zg.B48]MCR2765083.1 flavin reductase family protein [Microbacterium sp. zg.B48]